MEKTLEGLTVVSVDTQERAVELVEKLYSVAQPGSVFSEPMQLEGRTVITAAEVNVGLGIGFGFGGGSTPGDMEELKKEHRSGHPTSSDLHERVTLEGGGERTEDASGETEEQDAGQDVGMGGGGGGGGGASGRPIAVISVTEEGVEVEPVIDVTKIALAFFTALGSMFFMLTKMKKAADR